MASCEGLVPITRSFLASYYEKYPFQRLSDDVPRLFTEIRSLTFDLLASFQPSPEESLLVEQADRPPPHKVDENMWRNREQLEEIIFLLDKSRLPLPLRNPSTVEDSESASALQSLKEKVSRTLQILESFQAKNSERVFNTVMTYMPQDFRGTLIKQQRERSERNKQAEVDALMNSGGSIHDKYALLWKQQMDRRRQLAQLGSATGVYKALVKYLVGVPEVLLEFVQKINDDDGPMEEQRQRYGPPLYALTSMSIFIRLYIMLHWRRILSIPFQKLHVSTLEHAIEIYTKEFERYLLFISDVFSNSPFFITAEEAGKIDGSNNDEYKEITISAGKIHEVSLSVDSVNSYIAWDFSLIQGKMTMDIGFSVECIDASGKTTMILPYRRYGSDQGNFCTCIAGSYKLIWDNSYSSFFKKVLRYKVDCIPPVVENMQQTTGLGD